MRRRRSTGWMLRPLAARGDPLKWTVPGGPYLFTRAPGWVGVWDGTGPARTSVCRLHAESVTIQEAKMRR
jgi:hypothetical protein